MRQITIRRLSLNINLFKVSFGVAFSLVWARVMYLLWQEPSYITFIWFYLGIGSVLLKWVFFEIIDRIHKRIKLGSVRKELEQSDTRVQEASKDKDSHEPDLDEMTHLSIGKSLRGLEDELSTLADMVENAMKRAIEALKNGDLKTASQVIHDDQELDRKEFSIREDCVKVITSGHRNSKDLRIIVSVLGIITELERMGDYAEGIANITLKIGGQPSLKPLDRIPEMGDKGLEMLRESINSFLGKDVEGAQRTSRMDDDVDSIYDDVFRELMLLTIDNPDNLTRATWLVWVAHNLERFADRATNICEWAVYRTTGRKADIGASRY